MAESVSLDARVEFDGPARSCLDMFLGLGDYAQDHGALGVQSVFYDGTRATEFCSSDYLPEREAVRDYVSVALRHHGQDTSEQLSRDLVGLVDLYITPMPSEDGADSVTKVARGYENMRRGIRNVMEGWARHRQRFLLLSFHAFERIETEDGSFVDAHHAHILYERAVGDSYNAFVDEIAEVLEGKCSWDTIEVALGLIQLPEYVDDDEVFDGDEYWDAPPDDMDDLDDFDDMDDMPFLDDDE